MTRIGNGEKEMKHEKLKPKKCGHVFWMQSAATPVYIAEEADAVIANLKARINELESMPHTDNSAVIDLLSSELEKLRPMEAALEIAEADNKKHIARIKELEKEISETHKSYDALLNERNKLAHELHTIKKTITEGTRTPKDKRKLKPWSIAASTFVKRTA